MMQTAKKTSVRNRPRRVRLEAYLSAGVGCFGVLASAEAGVVTVDVSTFNGVNGGVASGSLATLSPLFTVGGFTYYGIYSPNKAGIRIYNGYGGRIGISGVDELKIGFGGYGPGGPTRFSAGSSIGAGASPMWGKSAYTMFDGPFSGTSPSFNQEYLGFRVGRGPFYYGWIEVSWNATSKEFQIAAMAYENTPDTPILAGDTGAAPVPEPASSAVVALLMGGTALRQWRKKRRDQDQVNRQTLAS